MVVALHRKTNDRILWIITEPLPQFSLFISFHPLENTATNKSLPVKGAHFSQSSPPVVWQSLHFPPGMPGSMHKYFKEASNWSASSTFNEKKKKKVLELGFRSWRGSGYGEPVLGFDSTIQYTKDQSCETNSAPEMKNLLLVLTTSVLFWRLLRRVLAGPTLFQFSTS